MRFREIRFTRPLVVDLMLVYSTYLGYDFAQGQAVAIKPAAARWWRADLRDEAQASPLHGSFVWRQDPVTAVVTEFNPPGSAVFVGVRGSEDELAVQENQHRRGARRRS